MSNPENISQLWQWQTHRDFSYLTCSLLSAWEHGFFTRQFHPDLPEDLTPVLQPLATTYRIKQVHGNLVLTTQAVAEAMEVSKKNLSNSFSEADGVISQQSQQSVWAASADCTPILIGDIATGRVCAIHAGWRGTAKKIVTVAIARFMDFGSKKENLRVAIGPAIAGEVYQVDKSVAMEVGKTIIPDPENQTDKGIIAALQKLPNTPIFRDDLPGKVRLDVSRVNQIQLEQLGLKPEYIAIAPYCTYQNSNNFFSYRRTGEKKVQWSGIVSNAGNSQKEQND